MTEQHEFWPGGTRIAVSVSMQFEAGGQPVSGAGGPITEPIPTSGRTASMSTEKGDDMSGSARSECSAEPRLRVETREELVYLLGQACEI